MIMDVPQKYWLKIFSLVLVLFVVIRVPTARSQTLTSSPHEGVGQVPIGSDVYSFLRHLSVRGAIKGYSETQLPISEYEVVTLLEQPDPAKLSATENALRLKYLRTYRHTPVFATTMFPADSAEPLFFAGIPTDNDKYLYRWIDTASRSDLFVHGIASLEFDKQSQPTSGKVVLGEFGGQFSGTLSGHVGYFLQATNGASIGDSTVAGQNPLLAKNINYSLFTHTDFDNTTAELSYNYDWFTAKLAREALAVGGSYQEDNIILSSNVPVYDFVSVAAHVGAVRYEAVLASLLGEGRFSVGYDTVTNYVAGAFLTIDPKYLALHDLTFTINNDFEFGFTDETVFSRRFDLAYINPFSFMETVQHSLLDRDNGLLSTHLRWQIANGVEIRGEGLVDDVLASKIGTGFWSNKFAWQLGGMWADPFGLSDLDIMAEWTHVEPYTFTHFLPQNAYTTSGTLLSNQIGPNSISYWGRIRWTPSERWTLQFDGELIQRGENIYDSTGKIVTNYGSDYEHTIWDNGNSNVPNWILQGNRVDIINITALVQYEPWRGLSVFVRGTDKMVHYHQYTAYPQEHPEALFAFGAQALF
jgi:hypothetical protein